MCIAAVALSYQNCHHRKKKTHTNYEKSEYQSAISCRVWRESLISQRYQETISLLTYSPQSFHELSWNHIYPPRPLTLPYLTHLNSQGPLPLPAAPMGLANLTACSNICLFAQHFMVQRQSQVSLLFIHIPLTIFQSFVCWSILTSICCDFSLIKLDYLLRTFHFLCC